MFISGQKNFHLIFWDNRIDSHNENQKMKNQLKN